jgi:8-oxo-dGTP pyrophosphatase MutT (NUDIX family)
MIFRRGKWDLPKGKLDEGETIEQCAVREVEEETGVRGIILGEKIDITRHEYFDQWINEEAIKETHWFKMTASLDAKLIPQMEEDITEIKWVKDDELKKCLENSYPTIVAIVAKGLK